ncbi:hypothetical protein MASR2M78_17320 [Treponema sp.]
MIDNRKSNRYPSLAHAKVSGLQEGEALLRDLSVTGCRLEFSAAIAFSEGTKYRIKILPESSAAVESFELDAEPRWSRAGYDSFEIGFDIQSSPKGKSFQRYVDYLSWRSSQPVQA